VKVLDFGIVKPLAGGGEPELTQDGFVTGTPSYMAPEMALGRPIDGRADVYALGCVGYFLLTGRTLFPVRDRTSMEILFDHAKTPPQRPSERAGRRFHRGLEDVLMSCLAKDPAQRPQSALELTQRLAALEL